MTSAATPQRRKTQVLVAEDRGNWRETFCMLLRHRGYEPLEATCGLELEEKAPHADVIVLDISMPMDQNDEETSATGLEVLMRLQLAHEHHIGIQHPIVRSMWDRSYFENTPYEHAKVETRYWVDRQTPFSDLIELIAKVQSLHHDGTA